MPLPDASVSFPDLVADEQIQASIRSCLVLPEEAVLEYNRLRTLANIDDPASVAVASFSLQVSRRYQDEKRKTEMTFPRPTDGRTLTRLVTTNVLNLNYLVGDNKPLSILDIVDLGDIDRIPESRTHVFAALNSLRNAARLISREGRGMYRVIPDTIFSASKEYEDAQGARYPEWCLSERTLEEWGPQLKTYLGFITIDSVLTNLEAKSPEAGLINRQLLVTPDLAEREAHQQGVEARGPARRAIIAEHEFGVYKGDGSRWRSFAEAKAGEIIYPIVAVNVLMGSAMGDDQRFLTVRDVCEVAGLEATKENVSRMSIALAALVKHQTRLIEKSEKGSYRLYRDVYLTVEEKNEEEVPDLVVPEPDPVVISTEALPSGPKKRKAQIVPSGPKKGSRSRPEYHSLASGVALTDRAIVEAAKQAQDDSRRLPRLARDVPAQPTRVERESARPMELGELPKGLGASDRQLIDQLLTGPKNVDELARSMNRSGFKMFSYEDEGGETKSMALDSIGVECLADVVNDRLEAAGATFKLSLLERPHKAPILKIREEN